MDENAMKLFKYCIQTSEILVEQDFKQLCEFDNAILAAKENPNSNTGFSFLILQFDHAGNVIFRGNAEEFQNASTIFLLRTKLKLADELEGVN